MVINYPCLFVSVFNTVNKQKSFCVYIVRCCDGTLYTGSTQNIKDRVRRHNGELSGGARYTRGRRPVELVYSEHFPLLANARAREREIKKLGRQRKEALVENWQQRNK